MLYNTQPLLLVQQQQQQQYVVPAAAASTGSAGFLAGHQLPTTVLPAQQLALQQQQQQQHPVFAAAFQQQQQLQQNSVLFFNPSAPLQLSVQPQLMTVAEYLQTSMPAAAAVATPSDMTQQSQQLLEEQLAGMSLYAHQQAAAACPSHIALDPQVAAPATGAVLVQGQVPGPPFSASPCFAPAQLQPGDAPAAGSDAGTMLLMQQMLQGFHSHSSSAGCSSVAAASSIA